jgi:hypothetical protein
MMGQEEMMALEEMMDLEEMTALEEKVAEVKVGVTEKEMGEVVS